LKFPFPERAVSGPFFSGLFLFLALLVGLAAPARAQSGAAVETSPQLFAVMCALHAAGYEMATSAPGEHPLRAQLRPELLRLQGPATEALRAFYREHRSADSAETLSRYISFAVVAGPPPKFQFLLRREDLPPDVLTLEGFNEILAAFYQEAKIEGLWQRVQPAYQQEVRRLSSPVGQIVFTATGYLREIPRAIQGRSFSVIVEPLVGGKTNSRRYRNDYTIVLAPGEELPLDDVRHAYLHYLLDPLAFRYPQAVERERPLHQFVGRAPRIPPEFRDDFSAFLTECLVRAVELRLRNLSAEDLAVALDEAESDGYVITRALFQALQHFDEAEPSMTFYFPELLQKIDVAAEARRLEKLKFAAALAPPVPEKPQESELETWLREAERRIALSDAPGAAAAFEKTLAKYPGQPRALYGMAVTKLMLRDGEAAKAMFQQVVTDSAQPGATVDPLALAMSHVYLGRILDMQGNRELALTEYRAALAVEGAPAMALRAAQRGIEKKFEPVQSSREAEPQRP